MTMKFRIIHSMIRPVQVLINSIIPTYQFKEKETNSLENRKDVLHITLYILYDNYIFWEPNV